MSAARIFETRGGGMVQVIIEAEDRTEAEAARDRYLNRWHPMGYGTAFNDPRDHEGVWRIVGSRMASCD